MRITICDDEPLYLAQVSGYVAGYIEKKGLDVAVVEFTSPSALLDYEGENGGSRIYLLDILMEGIDGVELGRRIRSYNPDAFILYLTTSREFALEAYCVHPASYLLKPVQPERLYEELERCLAELLPAERTVPVIAVKTAGGLVPLSLDRVDAVEYYDHRLVYHLTDGGRVERVTSRESFDLQAREFTPYGEFVKTASSYFVNLDNVLSIAPHGFRMKSGEEFPITKKYIAAKEAFLRHKFGGSQE